MIQFSPSISEIAPALFNLQGKIKGVPKDSINPHFKNRYASLEAVIDTAKPFLQAEGLLFMQAPGAMENGALNVTTIIIHSKSGQWASSTMGIPLQKQDPQGAGSALTYALRYSLMAMLGLPATDDDAEAATIKPEKKKETIISPAASILNEAKISARKGNSSLDSFILKLPKTDKISLSLHGSELRKIADDADAMS